MVDAHWNRLNTTELRSSITCCESLPTQPYPLAFTHGYVASGERSDVHDQSREAPQMTRLHHWDCVNGVIVSGRREQGRSFGQTRYIFML